MCSNIQKHNSSWLKKKAIRTLNITLGSQYQRKSKATDKME